MDRMDHRFWNQKRNWIINFSNKERFRSVNQGLNNKGRCCEVHAQAIPKIPTLAAMDRLLMRYASVFT